MLAASTPEGPEVLNPYRCRHARGPNPASQQPSPCPNSEPSASPSSQVRKFPNPNPVPPISSSSSAAEMKGSFAEELYSESLQQKIETDLMPSDKTNHSDSRDDDMDDFWHEDGSLWDGADQEVDKEAELDREWQRRHDQFHTIGYRDGVIAGKEAAAQEGFNTGFKESVIEGYNWGLVRGVTSALALLPDGLKERLIEPQEKRTEFQKLYESAHSLSTQDALRLFNDTLMAKKAAEQGEKAEVISSIEGLVEQRSERNPLANYFAELRSLLLESPAIKVHLA